MKVKPLHDRILVKRIDKETKSAGGLLLTGSMIRDSTTATVVDVGTGLLLENGEQRPNDLKIGDVVMFTASYEIKIEIIKGDEFLVIRESNVDAILENYENPALEVYDK